MILTKSCRTGSAVTRFLIAGIMGAWSFLFSSVTAVADDKPQLLPLKELKLKQVKDSDKMIWKVSGNKTAYDISDKSQLLSIAFQQSLLKEDREKHLDTLKIKYEKVYGLKLEGSPAKNTGQRDYYIKESKKSGGYTTYLRFLCIPTGNVTGEAKEYREYLFVGNGNDPKTRKRAKEFVESAVPIYEPATLNLSKIEPLDDKTVLEITGPNGLLKTDLKNKTLSVPMTAEETPVTLTLKRTNFDDQEIKDVKLETGKGFVVPARKYVHLTIVSEQSGKDIEADIDIDGKRQGKTTPFNFYRVYQTDVVSINIGLSKNGFAKSEVETHDLKEAETEQKVSITLTKLELEKPISPIVTPVKPEPEVKKSEPKLHAVFKPVELKEDPYFSANFPSKPVKAQENGWTVWRAELKDENYSETNRTYEVRYRFLTLKEMIEQGTQRAKETFFSGKTFPRSGVYRTLEFKVSATGAEQEKEREAFSNSIKPTSERTNPGSLPDGSAEKKFFTPTLPDGIHFIGVNNEKNSPYSLVLEDGTVNGKKVSPIYRYYTADEAYTYLHYRLPSDLNKKLAEGGDSSAKKIAEALIKSEGGKKDSKQELEISSYHLTLSSTTSKDLSAFEVEYTKQVEDKKKTVKVVFHWDRKPGDLYLLRYMSDEKDKNSYSSREFLYESRVNNKPGK